MAKLYPLIIGFSLYATFMIGYFLLLTSLMPSILVYEPEWIDVGIYSKYIVEEYVAGDLVENGTYIWRITSLYRDADGELMARVNETYNLEWKRDWWNSTWTEKIPANGRISEIKVKDGIIECLPLWFNRYYNHHLADLSIFTIGDGTFEGMGIETIPINDETTLCIRLTLRSCRSPPIRIPPYYTIHNYWFDERTGLLLKYTHGFRDYWTQILLKLSLIHI